EPKIAASLRAGDKTDSEVIGETRRFAAAESCPKKSPSLNPRQLIFHSCRLARGHIPMNKSNSHGAFPDRRGAAFDRIVSNIARGKHSRHIGFQIIRIPVEWPIVRTLSIS